MEVKRPEREADQSPPSSAEVKMRGAIPALPQYVFIARYLVKHRAVLNLSYMLTIALNKKISKRNTVS